MIHIGSIGNIPEGEWRFCFSSDGIEVWSLGEFSGVKSLITSVPKQGSYRIFVEDGDDSGFLFRSSQDNILTVSDEVYFCETASFVRSETRTPIVSASAPASVTASPRPRASAPFKIYWNDVFHRNRYHIIHLFVFVIVVPMTF
jgi:hypothetical protein